MTKRAYIYHYFCKAIIEKLNIVHRSVEMIGIESARFFDVSKAEHHLRESCCAKKYRHRPQRVTHAHGQTLRFQRENTAGSLENRILMHKASQRCFFPTDRALSFVELTSGTQSVHNLVASGCKKSADWQRFDALEQSSSKRPMRRPVGCCIGPFTYRESIRSTRERKKERKEKKNSARLR